MARKKKRKTRVVRPFIQSAVDAKDQLLAETRSADAATVGWTLAAMATLGALALRGIVLLILSTSGDPKTLPQATPFIPPLMHFAALVTGIVAICLTPLVYRLRQLAPPGAITTAIIVIGLTPLVLFVLNW